MPKAKSLKVAEKTPTTKAPQAKAADTKPVAKAVKEDKTQILGTAGVAERLGIDPKKLRSIIRASAEKTNGGKKYEFREGDIPTLAALVAAHTRTAAARQ